MVSASSAAPAPVARRPCSFSQQRRCRCYFFTPLRLNRWTEAAPPALPPRAGHPPHPSVPRSLESVCVLNTAARVPDTAHGDYPMMCCACL